MPLDLLVLMETSTNKSAAVKALEDVARMHIPTLVPKSYGIGKGTTEDGLDVEFSISEFVVGAESLEDIWPSLNPAQKEALMDKVVTAIKKLQHTDIRRSAEAANSPPTDYIAARFSMTFAP